jgi:cystathionine beta-synthase
VIEPKTQEVETAISQALITDWEVATTGPTPVVALELPEVELLAKLEYMQPGSSVKARIGRPLLEELAAGGQLTAGTRYVVEASSGNTAIALRNAIDAMGLPAQVVAVVTDKVSQLKIDRMIRRGVMVRVVPFEVSRGASWEETPHMRAMLEVARGLPDAVLAGQFTSAANPRAHENGTGREIVEQLMEPPDAIVLGAGSGGTLTGVGRALRKAGWNSRIVLADPVGSVIGPTWLGRSAEPGRSMVEGIGHDFIPKTLDLNLIDEVVMVPDQETRRTWRQLADSGFPVGSSSACAVTAARVWAARRRTRSTCLVFFSDHGSRYRLPDAITS